MVEPTVGRLLLLWGECSRPTVGSTPGRNITDEEVDEGLKRLRAAVQSVIASR